MTTWFELLGIGSYYLRSFALSASALAVAASLAWKFRRRLPRAVRDHRHGRHPDPRDPDDRARESRSPSGSTSGTSHRRTSAFDNGAPSTSTSGNTSGGFEQPPLANLAVGSSQVGAIFSHWSPPTPMPLQVFSLAGMKTPDYWLYRHEIAARNPERVILYLSAFDLTAGQEAHVWPLAPAHPLSLWTTQAMLRSDLVTADAQAAAAHAFLASQMIPEYRASYIFRGFMKRWTNGAARIIAGASVMPVAMAAAVAEPAPQAPEVDEAARQRQFVSYYLPEWLDYNYRLLRSFVAFCRERNIEVLIVEGQINPIVKSEKLEMLGDMVRSRFRELQLIHDNVRIVWARDNLPLH